MSRRMVEFLQAVRESVADLEAAGDDTEVAVDMMKFCEKHGETAAEFFDRVSHHWKSGQGQGRRAARRVTRKQPE